MRLHSLLHTHHRVLGPHSELVQLFELVVGADGQAEHVQLDHLVLFKELTEWKTHRLKKIELQNSITYLEGLVLETDAYEFLVAVDVLLVARELKGEHVNVEVDAAVYFFEFSVHF